jgi:hypothetical protein
MNQENTKPWHEFKPNVPAQIEGTDVPLVTDQPVEIIPKKSKKEAPQVETLLTPEQELATQAAKKVVDISKSSKSGRNRQGLSPQGRLNADGPPPHISDARKTY